MVLQGASGGQTMIFSSVPVTSKATLRTTVAYEEESNDTFETSEAIALPCEVLGSGISATGGTDTDYYSFSLAAGDDVLITVQTDSVGSQLTPTVTLYNAAEELGA